MARILTVLLLLVAFAAQTFSKAVIVLDYYTNTALFAQNCENKDRPALKCEGKCQMMKKLQAEEKKEQQNPEHKGADKGPMPNVLPPTFLRCAVTIKEISTHYPPFRVIPVMDQSYPILHPPALL